MLDRLREQLQLLDDAGRPFVLVVAKPLKPAASRLMASLGVRVEVQPMSKQAVTPAINKGLVAQDYRASRARAVRRIDAGEEPALCIACATELDAGTPVHEPGCRLTPPLGAEAAVGDARSRGLEKGRNGRIQSVNERNASGELTVGEMNRRHEERIDALPIVVRCGMPGCEEWSHEGPASEAREKGREHRAAEHPELVQGKRRMALKPGQSSTQVRPVEEPSPLEEPLSAPEPDEPGVTEEVDAVAVASSAAHVDGASTTLEDEVTPGLNEVLNASSTRGGSTKRWPRERCIAAIKEWAQENGRPPTSTEWMKKDPEKRRPTASTVANECGSWGDAIEDAGYPRPIAGGRGHARADGQFDGSGSSTSIEVAKPEANAATDYSPPESHTEATDGVEIDSNPEPQQIPVVWAVKVPDTGLRYRSADEAYVAADEIEHDGDRVAREARIAGQEGKADQAIDASRELAEKIRAAALACKPHAETSSPEAESPVVEPNRDAELHAIGMQKGSEGEPLELAEPDPPADDVGVAASPEPPSVTGEPGSPSDALPILIDPGTTRINPAVPDDPPPAFSLALTGDFARDAQRVRAEAARLRSQADALDLIAAGIDQLEAA